MAQDPRALLLKADKALSSASGGFGFFSNKEDKYQNAADLYVSAANAFRMQKMNQEAGQAFEKAAQVFINNLQEPDDAANVYVDAFKMYRTTNPEAAVQCLDYSINNYCSKGNFRRAATHKETEGELFELKLGDTTRAVQAYEQAAEWYDGDNATALANKLWLKVADLAALNEDYYKAISIYEKVAKASINNNLMKYSLKDWFLKAGICSLCTKDMVDTERKLNEYLEMDPAFSTTREHQLLLNLLEAVQAGDQQVFTDVLFNYDKISKLDSWKTNLLLKVKNGIDEADNEFS